MLSTPGYNGNRLFSVYLNKSISSFKLTAALVWDLTSVTGSETRSELKQTFYMALHLADYRTVILSFLSQPSPGMKICITMINFISIQSSCDLENLILYYQIFWNNFPCRNVFAQLPPGYCCFWLFVFSRKLRKLLQTDIRWSSINSLINFNSTSTLSGFTENPRRLIINQFLQLANLFQINFPI